MIFEQKVAKKAKGVEVSSSSPAVAHSVSPCSRSSLSLLASVPIVFLTLLLLPLGVRAEQSVWAGLWFTPDQQGQRYFERGEFAEAALHFSDPLWQGVAWYRAGEFEKAAQAFARRDTAEAHYNRGNAHLMHGDYAAAIASYDRAVEKRPDWKEAVENRAIAAARAEALDIEGGNMTEGMLGADKIVFDSKKKGSDAQTTEIVGGKALSDQEMQALWLRRVQTRPADFLKAKFAYQQAVRGETK